MDTTVLEKETSVETAQNNSEDSVEYRGGGFNKWGVNVENNSKSSRHSAFLDEEPSGDDGSEPPINMDPGQIGQIASSITPTEESVEAVSTPESNEEVTSSDEPQTENFAYYVAKQMIQEGALPNFDDVDEDITFEDIYENYKVVTEEKVKTQVLGEVQATLQSAGVTDENLVLLQAIQNGVPLDELYEVNKYQKYSQFDDSADSDLKLEVIKEWYKSRNLSEREINRNLEAIELSDEIDTEFDDAKNFFAQTLEEYHKAQRQIALQELEQRKAIQLRNADVLNKAVTQGVLANERLTSEQSQQLQRDIYERNKVYNIEGQQVPLSPFE